uniref:Major facilitator superfamily protein n=1 Tax=Phyllotreta armoraciae TaxID=1553667 RepID=A0A858Z6C5_9CUCU|nr:major facilitator superfamily protein [Phyllotreta armoraciae]
MSVEIAVTMDPKLTPKLRERRKSPVIKHDTLFLYSSVVTAELLFVPMGASMVWTSPVIGKLVSNDTEINPIGRQISILEVSMLTGIPELTNIIGLLFVTKLADVIGRKRYLLLAGAVMLISGIGLAFSNKIAYMILARCAFGFPGVPSVIPVYIAEICEDLNRGKFGCYSGIFHQIGNLFGFVIGPILSVKYYTLVITAPALIFIILFLTMPESPVYLLKHGNEEECKVSLKRLRSNKTDQEIDMDLEKLKKQLENEPKGKVTDLFKKREHIIGLLLGFLPVLIKYCSGVTVLFMYLAPFFDSAETSLSGDLVAIIVAVFKISLFTVASFVVENFGRRKLILISSCGTALPLCALGVFFYLKHIESPALQQLQWLPLTGLLITVSFFGLGLGPIPNYLVIDFFPADLRTVSSSIVNASGSVAAFALASLFPIVTGQFGTEWCVWWFSVNCVAGAILIYLFLPETKGKSLDEIQKMLER